MQRRRGTALFVAVLLVIQLVCWRGTARLRSTSHILKRSLDGEAEVSKKKGKHTSTSTERGHHTSTSISTTSTTSTSTPTPSPSIECQPLPFALPVQDLCDHIRLHCPASGHLDYLQFYYCIGLSKPQETPAPSYMTFSGRLDDAINMTEEGADVITAPFEEGPPPPTHISTHLTALRVVALICIISWMLFLFSWVGVVASDFFCPNLGTIAARLGLSESTAGVTFLAFGNGSPDVFSTFGAMKSGSGSLAIGELIGAASFIVSVISGSMMLIAPFRVKPYPFIRDVGFFTVAVSMTMIFLFDGKLRFNECLGMISLYFAYATTVIVGSWWQERRRRKRHLMSTIRDEYSTTSIASQEHTSAEDLERQASQRSALSASPTPRMHQISPNEYDPDVDPFSVWQQGGTQRSSRSVSPHHSPLLTGYDLPTTSSNFSNTSLSRLRPLTGARHSLLGAVEFRDVVRSLQQEALADRSVEIYQSRDPERFLPHHHHHQHHLHPDSAASQPIRRHSQRGHARIRSVNYPGEEATGKDRSVSVESRHKQKPGLFRSRSTNGAGSSGLTVSEADQDWSMTKRTQPSAFDATAVAAAVGDPWKEHSASDGCEHTLLPPPARPLLEEEDHEDDDGGREERASRPELHIQTSSRTDARSSSVRRTENERIEERREAKKRRKESRTRWQNLRRSITPTLKVLFPSLSHFHEKSWLGIGVGVITAPAIMILNLTLPVVDDEAESAALVGEEIANVSNVGRSTDGRIRLEGADNDLYASTRRTATEDDDDDDDENIITLDSTTPPRNPWSGSDAGGEEHQSRRTSDGASALRRLPHDTSALLNGSPHSFGSPRNLQILNSPNRLKVSPHPLASDADSDTDSCDSQDSHLYNTQSSHLSLVLAQCVFAPPFIVWAIGSSADSSHLGVKVGFASLTGSVVALLALLAVLRSRQISRSSRSSYNESGPSLGLNLLIGWARVAVGFLVSILYIMTIVDEVVSILQTLGIILGLSDAILGLTVFAMGNSLGDLVANITIAKMGHPVMAISACFAGPLLNLLLGIGISGTWLLSGNRIDSIPNQPGGFLNTNSQFYAKERGIYQIDFSPTLTVSGVGLLVILLGTLIAVPLNNFYLNKTIGLTLIVTYAVIMTINVMVEIYYLDRKGLQ